MRVERANRSELVYEIDDRTTACSKATCALEGQRESRDFGTRDPGALVIVVSKKDELVCMDCEELAASGPMPIEIAAQHVPKHPNCRCVIMPYVQTGKRLPVTMTTLTGTDPAAAHRGRSERSNRPMTLANWRRTILDKTSTTDKGSNLQ